MLAIKNNLMASNAARHLGKAYDGLAKSVERLASGLRINSAKDDAAGLAVRELIRADVAVLQQGSRNASDGISMLQTMEGAMGVIDENLIRMKELAEQAATGSYSDAQRTIMNSEFSEMASEIDRIAGATKFNDIAMLNSSSGSISIHVGTASTIDVDKVDMTESGLGIETGTGNWAIMTSDDAAVADTDTTTVLSIVAGATNDFVMKIQFAGEQAINVDFSGAATPTTYTLQAVVDKINAASNNPSTMFDDNGTSFGYSAAKIVQTSAGNYKLELDARSGDATSVALTATNAQTADAVLGIFANAGVAYTAAGIMTGGALFQKYNESASDWVSDATGGAGAGLNILTTTSAIAALDTITSAINAKDTARASFGYKMNRLESTISILDIQAENLMSAESRISDVDVSTEMATLTRTQVLAQAGISMLAQANSMPQMALTLLR
jgi:flagellin